MQPPRPRCVSPMVRSNFTRSHTNSCVKLAGCCTRSHDVFASNQGHGRVLCDCHGQICFHPFAILSMLLECDHAPGRGLRLHNCTRTFTTAHSVSDSAQQFSSKLSRDASLWSVSFCAGLSWTYPRLPMHVGDVWLAVATAEQRALPTARYGTTPAQFFVVSVVFCPRT